MELLNNFILNDTVLESALSNNEYLELIKSRIKFVNEQVKDSDSKHKQIKYGEKKYQLDISLSLICISISIQNPGSKKIWNFLSKYLDLQRLRGINKYCLDAQFIQKLQPKISFIESALK